MPATNDTRLCALRLAADGQTERCPRERCQYWEPGGAVVEAGCVIDRLAFDVRRPDIAAYLLETRQRLEEARSAQCTVDAHALFARRVGLEL